jgi:hypothetical protein
MVTLPERPLGANVTDPPAALPRVDLGNPEVAKAWAADLLSQIHDAIAAGLDATAPPASRRLGRRLAREEIRGAEIAINDLFAAAGFAAVEAPRLAFTRRTVAAPLFAEEASEARGEIAGIRTAMLDVADAHREDERADVLEGLPLAGVLFLALAGSPGERVAIDPPILFALRALRETVIGWASVRGGSTVLASVPLTELDRLACRIEATIEIARRGAAEGVLTEGGTS